MSYQLLQEEVYEANMQLHEQGLVFQTFGNASAIDRDKGVFGIKPSGVDYQKLSPKDIVILDLENNRVLGELRPSSDTKTHAYLYRSWSEIGGIVHTHSTYATAWAQTQLPIPILGTTHADHLVHDIPCAAPMQDEWIANDYETMTGKQIVECLSHLGLAYEDVGMILVANHGPFTWGDTIEKAVYNSSVLEQIAKMAFITRSVHPEAPRLKDSLIHKHYDRKHGKNAYYGQE